MKVGPNVNLNLSKPFFRKVSNSHEKFDTFFLKQLFIISVLHWLLLINSLMCKHTIFHLALFKMWVSVVRLNKIPINCHCFHSTICYIFCSYITIRYRSRRWLLFFETEFCRSRIHLSIHFVYLAFDQSINYLGRSLLVLLSDKWRWTRERFSIVIAHAHG